MSGRAGIDRTVSHQTLSGASGAPDGTRGSWGGQAGLTGNIRWIGEAPDGAVWALAQPSTLARIDPRTNVLKIIGAANGLTADRVVRGSFDSRGQLWIATPDHLYLAEHPGASARFHRLADGPARVWDIAEDPRPSSKDPNKKALDRSQTLWATGPQGLWRYQYGKWDRYSTAEGLQSPTPYRIAFGPDHALWLRHRYDGVIERVEFEGDRLVRSMSIQPRDIPISLSALHGFDQSGHFWLGSAAGLAMLDRLEMPPPALRPGGRRTRRR
jgi:ligand-binding sensor domain-containing protein